MRRAVLLVLLASCIGSVRLAAAPPQSQTPRQVGLAARRLTSTDLHDIADLVKAQGRPWMVIADWPDRDPQGWQWVVRVYMFPDNVKGTVVHGKVVVLKAMLPGANSFSGEKRWQISGPSLTYADLSPSGQVNFLINSDRDPRRPFITKPSERWGQISDADLMGVVAAVHSGLHTSWAISEVAVMDRDLVSVEATDNNPARDAAASILLARVNGQWTVTQSMSKRAPSPMQLPAPSGSTTPRSTTLPAGVVVTLAAGLNAFGLWVVFAAWKSGRGSPQFILGLLPVSLMFLIAPVPAVIFQMIRDFASFASSGGNAAAMLATGERGFLFGAFGFVLSLTAAAALQWHAGWDTTLAEAEAVTAPQPKRMPATLLMFSAGIALPVFLFGLLVERLPRTFMEQAIAIMQPTGASPPDPQHVTRLLSGGLVLGFIGGIVGAIVVALVGVATLILVRSHRFSAGITTFAWIVLAVAGLFGVLNLSRVVIDLNWLTTMAARPPL